MMACNLLMFFELTRISGQSLSAKLSNVMIDSRSF
jgi:hypothetical protein